jgi:hypothetical protein
MITVTNTRRNSAWKLSLTGLFATCFALSAQTTATAPTYNTASLQGTFVLSESGTNQQLSAPYAAIAILNLDGAGNVTGSENFVTGAFAAMGNTVTGTYTVGAGGWGAMSLTMTASDGSGTTFPFNYGLILTSKGVVVTRADNGVFAQITLAPQVKGTFSNAGASGSFVLQELGNAASVPFSLISSLTLDGNGNVAGNAAYQSLGVSYTATVSGIYNINPDGSGQMTLTLSATAADGTPVSRICSYSLGLINAMGNGSAISTDPDTTGVASISVR